MHLKIAVCRLLAILFRPQCDDNFFVSSEYKHEYPDEILSQMEILNKNVHDGCEYCLVLVKW